MIWTKSSITCPCVERLFDFLSCFCFVWILTIKSQTWPLNNLPVCHLVTQLRLITLVFCPPRLMAPLTLKTLSLSSIPLLLFLIGKTSPQVLCVLNSILPASVATLQIAITGWLDPSRLTFIAFVTLFKLSMLLIKMYLRLKLKLSVNNMDEKSQLFQELQDLARNAYPVEVIRNEILLTTFFPVCPTPKLGGSFAKRNPQMMTLHCKQQWKLILFLKSAV